MRNTNSTFRMFSFHLIPAAILASALLLSVTVEVQGYPLEQTTDCRTSADCGVGECCVLGMMRYSTPQCLPMGQVEDFCREDSSPENRTLYYPNGETIDVYEIYTHVCPCDSGLQCVDNSCSQGENYDNNYIY